MRLLQVTDNDVAVNVEVSPAAENEKPVVRRLLEHNSHDFTVTPSSGTTQRFFAEP